MATKNIIQKIKKKIPKGKKVYLDGHYKEYLWWYVHKEDGFVWIEFETSADSTGRMEQHAEDFDDELLESVYASMTNTTVPETFPVGATQY